jgi:putative sterol carrier protein
MFAAANLTRRPPLRTVPVRDRRAHSRATLPRRTIVRPARLSLAFAAALACASALAAPTMMSADWAKDACDAWNQDPVLTGKLVESGWVKNDKGRGYKVMQVYRTDCGDKPTAEMRVSLKDGKAACTYGGAPQSAPLDSGADYVMKAATARWIEMGKGEYGPMGAMMTGRLGFDGPMFEAMGNMGPFESFLLLVGKVPADTAACPAKP